MAANAILSLEDQQAIETDLFQWRAEMGLTMVKIMVGISAAIMAFVIAIWFFAQEYNQFLVFAVLVLVVLGGWGTYPHFHKRGQHTLGLHFAMIPLSIAVIAAPLLMPEILTAAAVALPLIFILANLFLGGRSSLFMVVLTICGIGIDLIVLDQWDNRLFTPLDEDIGLVLNIGITLAAAGVTALAVRLIVLGQEQEYRKAKIANREIERRAEIEQQQRQQLEEADLLLQAQAENEQQRRQLVQVFQVIRETVGVLNASVSEIQAAARQQLASTTEQDTAVTQTVATVEQVKQLTRNAGKHLAPMVGQANS